MHNVFGKSRKSQPSMEQNKFYKPLSTYPKLWTNASKGSRVTFATFNSALQRPRNSSVSVLNLSMTVLPRLGNSPASNSNPSLTVLNPSMTVLPRPRNNRHQENVGGWSTVVLNAPGPPRGVVVPVVHLLHSDPLLSTLFKFYRKCGPG